MKRNGVGVGVGLGDFRGSAIYEEQEGKAGKGHNENGKNRAVKMVDNATQETQHHKMETYYN